MQKVTIGQNESGQRLDKFLAKYLKQAPKSFLYKMLRKKNITLNEKKAEGSEKLESGDIVTFWLSDETLAGIVKEVFDLRPEAIIEKLDLRKPIYKALAAYGHMGREDLGVKWEETDKVDALKKAAGI